ncbi:hypothetical protein SLS62_009490 [Diatrype stigma]|uniref:Uncharacterized protein n=1 Tax=Diatrype stigma TaxID=117547 RepID=A0AAN9UDW4_9PEZI
MWRRGFFAKKGKSEKEADESVNLYNANLQSRTSHATPFPDPSSSKADANWRAEYSPGLASNYPGSQPNSPGYSHLPYNQGYRDTLSSTATDWNGDSRHVSELSGLSWDAVVANNTRKHYSQLSQGPPAMELDGTTATPAQAYQGYGGGQHTSELDSRATELPRLKVTVDPLIVPRSLIVAGAWLSQGLWAPRLLGS